MSYYAPINFKIVKEGELYAFLKKIKDEEAIVEMFAKGIYQVLQDNGARFFDLAIPNDSEDLK